MPRRCGIIRRSPSRACPRWRTWRCSRSNQLMPELGKPFAELAPPTQHWVQTVTVLAGGGGFIITSLLWGTALAHMIDGRVRPLVATLLLAAVFSWFGVIHSPLPSSPIMTPGAVIRQLEARRPSPGVGLSNPVSLGGRLCSDGAGARGARPVRLAGRTAGKWTQIRCRRRRPLVASERFGRHDVPARRL